MSQWDDRYAQAGFAYGTAPNEFLVQQAGHIPSGSVLCLADGEGRNCAWLAERGYDVTSVDLSALGLAKARQLAASRNVTIKTVHADLAEFVIEPESWSDVVSIFNHMPSALRRSVFRRSVAALKKDGVFILEAYTPKQLDFKTGGPSDVEWLMTVASLREDLAGLEFDIAQEIEREVHEGQLHNGPSAVVQFRGHKK